MAQAAAASPDRDAAVLLARWRIQVYGTLGARRISQGTLATDAGVSQRALERLLAGEVWPEFRTLYRLSVALGVPLPGAQQARHAKDRPASSEEPTTEVDV